MTKQNNPRIDFGFYAGIPRIVRTGYKTVSPIQKWLYTCLKDLCGESGTCYRTILSLAEETGISTGMLSESIPALHQAGLIHAEKKKRSSGGKPVWHITIVDIWQANAIAHPTKRSHGEQTTATNVHTANVHDVNVHTVNETSSERSPDEPERSHSETEVISSLSSIITEEREESIGTSAHATVQPPSSSLSQDDLSEDETPMHIVRPVLTLPSKPSSPLPAHSVPVIPPQVHGEQAAPIANETTSQLSTSYPQGEINGHDNHSRNNDNHSPTGVNGVTAPGVTSHTQRIAPAQQQARVETTPPEPGASQKEVTQANGKPTGNGRKKAEKPPAPQGPPQMPPEDAPWNTSTCLALFDARRGTYLIAKYQLMEASHCAKGLAEQYSRAQVVRCIEIMEKDPWYVKNGVQIDVCNVGRNIHKYLKQINAKPKAPVLVYGKEISDVPRINGYRDLSVEMDLLEKQYGGKA